MHCLLHLDAKDLAVLEDDFGGTNQTERTRWLLQQLMPRPSPAPAVSPRGPINAALALDQVQTYNFSPWAHVSLLLLNANSVL